jgi:hypothetical protein
MVLDILVPRKNEEAEKKRARFSEVNRKMYNTKTIQIHRCLCTEVMSELWSEVQGSATYAAFPCLATEHISLLYSLIS